MTATNVTAPLSSLTGVLEHDSEKKTELAKTEQKQKIRNLLPTVLLK
jgi:hypothetical protein